MTTIPATVGEPYEVTTYRNVIRLQRTVPPGRTVHMLFAPADALAVADALVDAAESMQ